MRNTTAGKLYLIGAGPGDPELLTVKATRLLRECDVVLYDRLVSREVLSLTRPDAELIYVGKHEGEQDRIQDEIFAAIRSYALNGKVIGRLKGGDPLVFGRGAEEWALALDLGLSVEFVPGISSALAVPSLAGIPLTFRGVAQSFAVVAGRRRDGDKAEWHKYLAADTLVIVMGVRNRAFIAESLVAAGRRPDEPVAFIERGSTPSERVVESTLEEVARGVVDVTSPAVFVIGQVVKLRRRLTAQAESRAQPALAAPAESDRSADVLPVAEVPMRS